MSVATDLAALYAEPFLTCPVQVGAATVRGFFDEETAALVDDTGAVARVRTITLRLLTAAVPALAVEDTVRVGTPGGTSATGGRQYRVRAVEPAIDGLEVVVTLARAS